MKVSRDENGKTIIDVDVDKDGKCHETSKLTKLKEKAIGIYKEHESGVKAGACILAAGFIGTAMKNRRKKRSEIKNAIAFRNEYSQLEDLEHRSFECDGYTIEMFTNDPELYNQWDNGVHVSFLNGNKISE